MRGPRPARCPAWRDAETGIAAWGGRRLASPQPPCVPTRAADTTVPSHTWHISTHGCPERFRDVSSHSNPQRNRHPPCGARNTIVDRRHCANSTLLPTLRAPKLASRRTRHAASLSSRPHAHVTMKCVMLTGQGTHRARASAASAASAAPATDRHRLHRLHRHHRLPPRCCPPAFALAWRRLGWCTSR